jgi:predicted DsbA family dithiol-disulfide isomerase
MTNVLQVDVYSDFVCPWCFIGTTRLERAIEEFALPDVHVRHHPYLLYPDVPLEGIDLRRSLTQRYRQDPERLFERVEAAGRQAGIRLDFSRVTRVYSTVPAHTLLRHAHEKATQGGLIQALFDAYFLSASNIADGEILTDLAAPHGFTHAEVARVLGDEGELARTRAEARLAARNGVRGVPLVIFNGHERVSGAQAPEVFRRAIATALASSSASRAETVQ